MLYPGEPIPLLRAKPNYNTRRMYNSQASSMLYTSIHLQSQHNSSKLFEGPLHLEVTFYFPFIKSIPKSKRINGMYKSTKPDLDNLVKWISDISNGVLYKDDAIIASICAKKVYDIKPRTEFTIQSMI